MSHTDSSDACAHRGWSTIKRRYGGCILALSLAASILSVVTLRPGQAAASPVTLPVTFTVPAGVAWTDTGDTLTPGKLVTVLASGTIGGVPGSGSPAGSPSPACLPATDASLYGPIVDTALNCWSLMGRFGASGQPFEIGASPTFMAQAGEFYLGVNDNKFSDNTGSWSAQVTSGTLAQALAIGQHDASRYSAGCTHKISPKGTDPVDCASGDFYDTFTDVSIPGRGPGLDLTRTYNSMAASNEGIFGYGWTCSYESSLVVNADSSVTITEADGSQVTATPNGSGGYTLPSWADSTLVENGGGTYTFVRQQTQIFTYSASGQLTSISDPNGYATTLGYTSGKLTTVTDAAGRALTFAYGTNGLVSSVTDPMSRETQYGYDTSGELTSVTDPLGRVTSFTYDSAGQHFLLTLTVPNGQSGGPDAGTTYTNTYDSVGQVLTQTDAMGQTTTYAYAGNNFSSSGGTTTITSPQGDVDVESYTNGELTSDTNGYGTSLAATTSYAYDATSLGTTSVTDPNGHTTTNTYDADGNLLTTKDALGNTTTYTYNALNEPLTITKPSGLVTTNTYDADGNLLTSSTTPAGASGSPYTWASADADGADGFNGVSCPSVGLCVGVDRQDVVVSTDPTGGASAWTSTTVDTSTQINAVSCPSTTLCLAADADGNVLSATNPTGSVAAWHYTDAVDYPIASISCPSTTLCVAVDTNGDVLTATNPASGPWSVANIDALAALDAVSCASSALCVAADNYGHVFTSTNPTGGASAWHSADVDGTEPVRAVDCPSVALCVAGDGDGHVLSATNPTGGASAWSSADVDGTTALLALSCPSAALCWASDATGHALVSTQPSAGASAWSSTDVDGSASISGLSCPSGDVCAGVDNAGHALSMTGKDPTAISLYANASDPGVVTETIDPAGHVTTYGYDSYGDTTSTTTHPTAQQSDTTQDVYDADGELVCEASPPEVAQGVSCPAAGSSRVADTLTWNYDADGEVTAAINADGQQTSTTYDADGNVVTVTDPVGNVTKDTY
ncbi:MAG TPA: DUF6531 domain-containing protein, partial [Acidimicrobiales bacterium]|nr:DUF6531 domain-containing protein [Acidimicrobiales bacterium]